MREIIERVLFEVSPFAARFQAVARELGKLPKEKPSTSVSTDLRLQQVNKHLIKAGFDGSSRAGFSGATMSLEWLIPVLDYWDLEYSKDIYKRVFDEVFGVDDEDPGSLIYPLEHKKTGKKYRLRLEWGPEPVFKSAKLDPGKPAIYIKAEVLR